jgi:D-alanyl-D-alanine carboxypeptidase
VMNTALPAAAIAQLPSPAADLAEELLEVVRSGDRPRIRAFVEARFSPDFIQAYPLDEYHVPVLASLGRQVEGLESAAVELAGPFEAFVLLSGAGRRMEVRVAVDPEPPHTIQGLGWGDAAPEIRARSPDELARELRRLAAVPPLSGVLLVARGRDVLLHEAYGPADMATGLVNQPETRFDVGSLNKLFTATAILRLARDGALGLDDTLGRFLDDFPPHVAERVTVRQLLEFRSGFGDYLEHPRFLEDPKRFNAPGDFLPLARAQELHFEPGAGVRYSNMGYVLLGAILERVTGRGYHDVMDELVFRPAGMRSAGARGGPDAARRYELQHGRFEAADALYPDVGSPAGGGFAAAADLHAFVEALLDGVLLEEEDVALLLSGFEARTVPEEVSFSGGAMGVNAAVRIDTADRLTVILLGNMGPLAADAMARRVQQAFY